jgi:hypothetical protein
MKECTALKKAVKHDWYGKDETENRTEGEVIY